jgi:hypothetical protein
MGDAYAYVALAKTGNGYRLVQCVKSDAEQAPREVESRDWQATSAYVRVSVRSGAVCQFGVSQDGQAFTPIGGDFQARAGRWIGAKVGLFCAHPDQAVNGGWADFDWFRFHLQ